MINIQLQMDKNHYCMKSKHLKNIKHNFGSNNQHKIFHWNKSLMHIGKFHLERLFRLYKLMQLYKPHLLAWNLLNKFSILLNLQNKYYNDLNHN